LGKLFAGDFIYPCRCSRKDVAGAAIAPHDDNEEPLYPGTCRPVAKLEGDATGREGINWRFRVPDGEAMSFPDERQGEQQAVAGRDFGDFIVWRKDDVPAYQLAVVVDDAAMRITEVVRGQDLLLSTFRQLLIYRALNLEPPAFYHAPLVTDEAGQRLAKRTASLSLRALRAAGVMPEEIRRRFGHSSG
jgi:glutamyl-tRNA synthetase